MFRALPVIEHAVEHPVHFASCGMRFKVWDAGSAMGQKTHTIAIVLAEKMGKFAFKNIRLNATDYDSANHLEISLKRNQIMFEYHDLLSFKPSGSK